MKVFMSTIIGVLTIIISLGSIILEIEKRGDVNYSIIVSVVTFIISAMIIAKISEE